MASKFAKVDTKHYCWWRVIAQYYLIYFILYPFFKTFFRVKVYGRENIPKDRTVIVAANHTSYFDPIIVSLGTKKPIAYMAKEELFHVPVLSQIIRILGAFSVNREKLEIATIKSAKEVLSKTTWNLGIFPEGTRIKGNKVGSINKGFGYLAKMTGADIVPFGILIERKSCPFWGKLTVKIGKPIPCPKTPEEGIDLWGKAISELTGLEYIPEQDSEPIKAAGISE